VRPARRVSRSGPDAREGPPLAGHEPGIPEISLGGRSAATPKFQVSLAGFGERQAAINRDLKAIWPALNRPNLPLLNAPHFFYSFGGGNRRY
jgi:hypothetical protein